MFPLSNGQLGSYRLIRRIGGGGMGEVYLAEDTRLGLARQVAIKTIRAEVDPYPNQAAAQDAERLFKREIQVIARLDHPFILPLYDYSEVRIDNTILTYMVMPFRPEGSLANWLQKRDPTTPLSVEEAVHFVEQAAQALHYAHSHNLIHQDVKPANFLMRDRSDQALPDILLSDFGIVKIATATTTASQNIRGTAAYMAPEQWNGQPVTATDQYALAIMAYLLLTRQYPFKGSMEQIMRQHFDQRPLPPSTLNAAIPSDLDTVILQALQKSSKDRFASILAFANAFRQASQPRTSATPLVLKKLSDAASSPLTIRADSSTPLPASDIPFPASVVYTPPVEEEVPPSLSPQPVIPGKPRSSAKVFITLGILVLVTLASIISGIAIHQHQINANIQATVDAQAAAIAQATADTQATAVAQAAATAQVISDNPCPSYIRECGSFSLALIDSLQGSSGAFHTGSNTSFGGKCQYSNNAFQASQQPTNKSYICYEGQIFSNFVFEVQMISLQGDCGGMMIEYNPSNGQGYLLEFCPNASEQYKIIKYPDSSGTNATNLVQGQSSFISNSGTNTLVVAVDNGIIALYANQQEVDSTDDRSFTSGDIALIAGANTNSTVAMYTHARVWA